MNLKDKHLQRIDINKGKVHLLFGYVDGLGMESLDLTINQVKEIYKKIKEKEADEKE